MSITLSRRAAICQSVAEVLLTGVALLGAVSNRFHLILIPIPQAYTNSITRLKTGSRAYNSHHERCTVDFGRQLAAKRLGLFY